MKGTGGVYAHANSKASVVVYVDDMLLLASPKDSDGIWRALEKRVCFKDPEASLARYLGARCRFSDFDPKRPQAPRFMKTDIDDYAVNVVKRFKAKYGRKLHRVTLPNLALELLAQVGEESGTFAVLHAQKFP